MHPEDNLLIVSDSYSAELQPNYRKQRRFIESLLEESYDVHCDCSIKLNSNENIRSLYSNYDSGCLLSM